METWEVGLLVPALPLCMFPDYHEVISFHCTPFHHDVSGLQQTMESTKQTKSLKSWSIMNIPPWSCFSHGFCYKVKKLNDTRSSCPINVWAFVLTVQPAKNGYHAIHVFCLFWLEHFPFLVGTTPSSLSPCFVCSTALSPNLLYFFQAWPLRVSHWPGYKDIWPKLGTLGGMFAFSLVEFAKLIKMYIYSG